MAFPGRGTQARRPRLDNQSDAAGAIMSAGVTFRGQARAFSVQTEPVMPFERKMLLSRDRSVSPF
jgi:hypothetical protein